MSSDAESKKETTEEEAAGFQMDSRWETQVRFQSIDDFRALAGQITFSARVPEDVKERFRAVRKLLVHSYFEYEFVDIAFERALFTLEMALKRRRVQLENETRLWDLRRERLYDLIEWAGEETLFEGSTESVHSLRHLRNKAAHPDQYTLAGVSVLNVPQRIAEVIEGVFGDPALRKKRKSERQRAQKLLDDVASEGAVLQTEADRLLIFRAELLHYENRPAEEEDSYWFLFWPIYAFGEDETMVDVSRPIVMEATAWEKVEESGAEGLRVRGRGEEGRETPLRLQRPKKPENIERLSDWLGEYEERRTSGRIWVKLQIGNLTQAARRYTSPYLSGPRLSPGKSYHVETVKRRLELSENGTSFETKL